MEFEQFTITLPDELPRLYKDMEYEGADEYSNLHHGVGLLGNRYSGNKWQIEVGNEILALWLEDIDYIWDDIPVFLSSASNGEAYLAIHDIECALIAKSISSTQLYVVIIQKMPNQKFWDYLNRKIKIEELGLSQHLVSKEAFFQEWKKFINSITDLLVKNNFINSGDPSIIEYWNRINID